MLLLKCQIRKRRNPLPFLLLWWCFSILSHHHIHREVERCQDDQTYRVNTRGVQGLFLMAVTTVRNINRCIHTIGRVLRSVVTTHGGERQGLGSYTDILCVRSVRSKGNLWRQQWLTTSYHTEEIRNSSGMKQTGRHFANRVTIKRHGQRIGTKNINIFRREGVSNL